MTQRFTINGSADTTTAVMTNLDDLATAAGSWITYDYTTGLWSMLINQAGNAVATFNSSNIIGGVVVSGTGLLDLNNRCRVTYNNLNILNQTDYVQIDLNPSKMNPNEPEKSLNLTLNFTNNQAQAQLIGYREMAQGRVDRIVEFDTDFTALGLRAGDLITVSDTALGIINEVYRVITLNERDDASRGIIIHVTALKYDSTVYTEANLVQYTTSTVNGIYSAGNIGVPNPVTVTATNISNVPYITVAATVPAGRVEGLEVWYTTDTTVTPDTSRNYTYVTTLLPPASDAGVFTTGESVVFNESGINPGNLYVKVRGINSSTVGAFSTPIGLTYTPTPTAGAITPATLILDAAGLAVAGYSAYNLFGKLQGLANGDYGNGSLFSQIGNLLNSNPGNVATANSVNNKIANIAIGNLKDVAITSVTNSDVLMYSTTGNHWVNSANVAWYGSAKFVGNTTPSGAVDGDIWFQI